MRIPLHPVFKPKHLYFSFLSLVLLLFSAQLSGQSYTLSTVPPYSSNNGSSAITFNLQTYGQGITVTQLGCAFSAGSTAEIWYNTTPINGTPSVSTTTGWVLAATTSAFTNSALPTPTPLPAVLNINIPPNTTYGFCINSTGSLQYLTGTITPTQINDTRINIINDPNVGYGGTITSWIANRQFCGSVTYNILTSGGPNFLPPLANFYPSQGSTGSVPTDTVWINSPYELVATSTNANRNYWDLPGENPLNPGYSRSNVGWTSQTYIDTAKYNQRFKYTYNRRGWWPVRLLSINTYKRDSLRDSVLKYIWVDTPATTPKANFFSARRKVGIGDYLTMVDISAGGPYQWYWTFDPPCNMCTTPPYFNNFFAGPTDQNPMFFGGDPGKFTICLQVWNNRGWDTVCKPDYIEVINSINVCSGSGATFSSEKEGYMFGPAGTGLSYTRTQVSGCSGFLLAPCADSIILWVDRIKMLPSDSLVIHSGTSQSSPVLRKIGGSNVNQLPASILQNGIRGGSRLFVRFQLGSTPPPVPYDSAGFSIRWEVMPASYPKPTSKMQLQDTVFSLQPVTFTSTSTGVLMQYSWDTDGNGIYDSTGSTATRSFLITAPQYRQICLVTYNCVGSDTVCKNVLFLPTTQKPVARFDVDKAQGFNTDSFYFSDKSLYGPSTWKWTFTPATAQFLNGTSSTSKDPVMRFTQRLKYTVKLSVTNQYGSDSLIKVDYINIGAYDEPQCLSDINLADGSIGISRVVLDGGIDTATNAYNPCFQIVGGNQAASLWRGRKHALAITRPSTTSPMDRKAWIDFNMDGVFANDELVTNEMNANNLTRIDSILVSNTQRLGSTRLRVGVTYAGTALNPSVTFLGVFRDYVVNFPMDTAKPTIALRSTNPYYTEINKPYVDSGVIAFDNIEGDISSKYEVIGTVNTSQVGPNYLKYIVRDLYGNVSDTLYRTVFVILNQMGPSIQLTGPSSVYVEVYNSFQEPGFRALDNQDNDISSQVILTTNLDTSKLGTYSNNYTIIDAFGLVASAQRTVSVGDTTKPMVMPKRSPYIHQVGTAINLTEIVNVTDNYWGAEFLTLTANGSVDVNNVGSYFITYSVRDNSGNVSETVLLEVKVQDTKPPVLILNGINPTEWEVKTSFIDPGVTKTDNYWPASTVVVSTKSTVNTNVLGEYTIWYIGTDPSGNKDSVMRVVKVVDRTKPYIDLLGVNEVNLPRWKEYVDAPIALIDNYNTDLQMRPGLIIQNSLPLNAAGKPFGSSPGIYSVHYSIRDLSGNESDLTSRRINVLPEGPAGSGEVLNLGDQLSIFPNPNQGRLNLQLIQVLPQDLEVRIFDILGHELLLMNIRKNDLSKQEIDLTKLPKGAYFVKAVTGEQVFTRKIQVN